MVMIIGAALTADLRRLALQNLCGRIIEIYGTNESGPISVIDSGGVGTLTGEIEAEVVDDFFTPVAAGVMGTVRLRGSGVVRGYMDDADATETMFRDGWFYPGDLAARDAQGRLKLLGRRADVLNLGGKKIACATLERKILAKMPVKDVAIVQRSGETSKAPVIACVVLDGPADMPSLLKKIRPILDYPFAVQVVAEIPRTPGGKIKRNALLQSLASPPT
jgi:acyl-coenzyme A synthetase/AMP-(fatty) acid ligase